MPDHVISTRAGPICRIELNRPDCGNLIETISSQPADAVKAVKEYLKFAPLMEPRGRADFAASVITGVLSSR